MAKGLKCLLLECKPGVLQHHQVQYSQVKGVFKLDMHASGYEVFREEHSTCSVQWSQTIWSEVQSSLRYGNQPWGVITAIHLGVLLLQCTLEYYYCNPSRGAITAILLGMLLRESTSGCYDCNPSRGAITSWVVNYLSRISFNEWPLNNFLLANVCST